MSHTTPLAGLCFLGFFLWIYIKTGLGLTITQYTEYNTFTPEHLKTFVVSFLISCTIFLLFCSIFLGRYGNHRIWDLRCSPCMSCTNVKCYSWIVFGVISSVTLIMIMSLLKYYRYPQQTCYDKTDGKTHYCFEFNEVHIWNQLSTFSNFRRISYLW